MKSKKNILVILACALALVLLVTGCDQRGGTAEKTASESTAPVESEEATTTPASTAAVESEELKTTEKEPEPTPQPSATEETTPETTEPEKTEPEETNPEATETQDVSNPADAEIIWSFDMPNAVGPGVWVSSFQNGKDMAISDIRLRVTSLTDDQEVILKKIEEYNAGDSFTKIDTELPKGLSFRLCEYEVYYFEGFPGYGDDGKTIYDPKVVFRITTEDGGGLDTTDGYSFIGLQCFDMSEKVDGFKAGDIFKGQVVYGIPDNAAEQYYLAQYYSDKDGDGNAITIYAYFKPEIIEVEE